MGGSQSFVADRNLIDGLPLFRYLTIPLGFLLFSRDKDGPPGERSNLMKLIEERASEAERGEKTAVLIFPEGCTTYGSHVIKFKKGAFVHLKKVKPYSNKVSYPSLCPNDGGGLSFEKLVALVMGGGWWTSTITELPVFEPNKFFWQNHWDGKEEKWATYARVVQTIIAEASDLKISECTLEDKHAFIKLIRNPKSNIE